MANENTAGTGGFLGKVWDTLGEGASLAGQIVADAHPVTALAMVPFGVTPTSIRNNRLAEAAMEERMSREREQFGWAREGQDFRREQLGWEREDRPLKRAALEDLTEAQNLKLQAARRQAFNDDINDRGELAASELGKELEALGVTGSVLEQVMRTEAVNDFRDFQVLGSAVLKGWNNPAMRSELVDYARQKGVELYDRDGEVHYRSGDMAAPEPVTPELLVRAREELLKKVLEEGAVKKTELDRSGNIVGAARNARTADLQRQGWQPAAAFQMEQAFFGQFTETANLRYGALAALEQMLDGKTPPDLSGAFMDQLLFAAKHLNINYAQTTDGRILINGTDGREWVKGARANDPVHLAWQKNLQSLQEGAMRRQQAAALERSGEEEPDDRIVGSMSRAYGDKYIELPSKKQEALHSVYRRYALFAQETGLLNRETGEFIDDLPKLQQFDRAWKLAVKKEGLDPDDFPSPADPVIADYEATTKRGDLKRLKETRQGLTRQMKNPRLDKGLYTQLNRSRELDDAIKTLEAELKNAETRRGGS